MNQRLIMWLKPLVILLEKMLTWSKLRMLLAYDTATVVASAFDDDDDDNNNIKAFLL